MKNFSIKRALLFSKLQLEELFLNKSVTEIIKLLLLRSFSICMICMLIKQEGIKECISFIELLLITFCYYFSFWILITDLLDNKGLINKLTIPATLTEKYVSIYISTLIIGTITIIPCIIISNIIMQIAIPLFFEEDNNGLNLIFGGDGNNIKQIFSIILITIYSTILTPVLLLWKQYKKTFFWCITLAFILSYILPIVFMYFFNTSKDTIKYIFITVTVVWSIAAVFLTNRGLMKFESK